LIPSLLQFKMGKVDPSGATRGVQVGAVHDTDGCGMAGAVSGSGGGFGRLARKKEKGARASWVEWAGWASR
jgi:hypothetical protein